MTHFRVKKPSHSELDALLQREEDFHFDCKDKRKKPSDLLPHVVGFANAHGGKIVVGLKDRKEGEGRARISGFVRPEEANNFVSILTREAEPPIRGLGFTFLDTGAKDSPFLLEISVPRSSRRHRASGKAYLRENAATNVLDERRAEVLGREKLGLRIVRSLPAVALALVGVVGLIFAYGWATEPQFSTHWVAYPTGTGLRDDYELRLEIGQTVGEGIVDVHGQLDFPVPISHVAVVNAGGCEQLEAVHHVLRAVTVTGADEKPSTTVEVRAARCPPQSKPVLRLTTDGSHVFAYDSPLLSDDGRLQVTYSWRVPVLGYRAPSRRTVVKTLPSPSTQWHSYVIPTRAYPASISNPPFYDMGTQRGRVAAYIRREDYETLPARGTSLAWVATPSARIALSYEGGFFKGSIHWLPCEGTVEVKAPPSFSLAGDDSPFRAIVLTWEGCTAKIDFAAASMDAAGNYLVQLH